MLVILIKDVSFQYFSRMVCFTKGRAIYVDPANLVAFADGIHFEISGDEFTYLQ